ncbi:ATP:cob(I)alamin adenosyltransferase, partial [Klebsiella pneumoniae]|nr:ATP:cob(I)alamin adenosyltransferase [Klebsiella pneumoniae]
LTSEPVAWLEDRIDIYADEPPEIEKFILPGGTQAASLLHMARTVTRRAEREIVGMLKIASSNEEVLKYVNRLSDYFFAVARV